MDALAFIEIVDRHRDVVGRHPVYRWPVRVGRSYDAEVILEDPFVAARHLKIEPAGDGRYAVTDLQSVNGMFVWPSEQRVAAAEVGPDDLVRLGRTQIRVRPPSYPVAEERPMRATAVYRRPAAFVAAAAVATALAFWNLWVMTTEEEEKYTIWFSSIPLFIALALWISVWSLVGRATGGRANFSAHGFVACVGFMLLVLAEIFFNYLSFGLDARWLQHAGTVAGAALFGYMIYRHLRLNSRAARRRLAITGAVVSVLLYGGVTGMQIATESAQEGVQRFDSSLKAPVFLFVAGRAPEALVADGQSLKRKVDAARTDR